MSLPDYTHWGTWLATTHEADALKVGDRVRKLGGANGGKIGTLEEIDRGSTFGHFVRFDGVQGLWGCYKFDLERITEQEAGHE